MPATAPEDKPRRRVSPRLIVALAAVPIIAVGALAAYLAWAFHTQLARTAALVEQVARAELAAVAANDQMTRFGARFKSALLGAWNTRACPNMDGWQRVGRLKSEMSRCNRAARSCK